MPMANAQKHPTASVIRIHLFTFHLSVQNQQPSRYVTVIEIEMRNPSIAKEVKSTISNSNKIADHSAFSAKRTTPAQEIGNTHAITVSIKSKEKIRLINGTKMQFNNNAQPET